VVGEPHTDFAARPTRDVVRPAIAIRRWIDGYAGEDFGSMVTEVLTFADSAGPELGAADAARARLAVRDHVSGWNAASG